MYAEKLKQFEKKKNLADKAYQHAVVIDLLEKVQFDDCSMHCFNYQQMFELLLKHFLETRSKFGAYPLTHKLSRLFEQVLAQTDFKNDFERYNPHLTAVTVCAEAYRYNFLIDCKSYRMDVAALNPLLDELVEFISTT